MWRPDVVCIIKPPAFSLPFGLIGALIGGVKRWFVCKFRDQAQQQAEQMRNRLGNNRDSILNQGAGNGSTTGRDR